MKIRDKFKIEKVNNDLPNIILEKDILGMMSYMILKITRFS